MVENVCLERTTAGSDRSDETIQMTPLSCPPLLLLQSSSPILSSEQCAALIEYFNHNTATEGAAHDYAKSLLGDVHDIIDKVTNCPRHDDETKLPRYVRYYPRLINEEILFDSKRLNDVLLPDGCHVDTNNGKLFRHITAILYLTDNASDNCNFGGSTTFPLAMPWIGGGTAADKVNDNALLSSATRLLERKIHHTKADSDQSAISDGRRLEMACVNSFNRDQANKNASHNTMGVRVMPQAGKLIFFHNINDDGMPDATSFHGGEELINILADEQSNRSAGRTKDILVFFKEISIGSFSDMNSFADCVAKARQWTIQTYYSCKT